MYTGIPAGFFLLKYGNREYGRETASPVPVPAGFLFFSCFPVFPAKTGHGRLTRDSVLVGTGFSRSRFHPYPQHWRPPCFSRRKAHDATTEEIQEERSRRGKSR
jgi:hypothetical protein